MTASVACWHLWKGSTPTTFLPIWNERAGLRGLATSFPEVRAGIASLAVSIHPSGHVEQGEVLGDSGQEARMLGFHYVFICSSTFSKPCPGPP